MSDPTTAPAPVSPAPPPQVCPACGAPQIPKSNDVDTWYACSQLYQLVDGIWKRNTEWDCREAFSAAIALRARALAAEAEAGALRGELENAHNEARETYREFICPKCGAEFEDNGKDYPNGLICSACPGTLKGVINPRTVKRRITQDEWDALCAERDQARAELEACRGELIDESNELTETLAALEACRQEVIDTVSVKQGYMDALAHAQADAEVMAERCRQVVELSKHYLRFADDNLYCANMNKTSDWESLHTELTAALDAAKGEAK